jgi:DNA-binding MarR family transcriptional regulator
MNNVPSKDEGRRRRGLMNEVRVSVRALHNTLALLNHYVGVHVELKDVEVYCLDLLDQEGPLSPGTLAKRMGLHPATMTGILDRMERAGWVSRDRDSADRRAVVVSARRERDAEMLRLYAGMNGSLAEILAGYREEELEVLVDFLSRAAEAGKEAVDELSRSRPDTP